MKKLLLIFVSIFLAVPVSAEMNGYMAGVVRAAGGGDSYIWFEDFEDAVTWDSDSGNLSEDCDGYDTDGDYCDQDTTNYVNGSQGMGIRGSGDYYVQKSLGSSYTNLELWMWIKSGETDNADVRPISFYASDDTYLGRVYLDNNEIRVVFSGGDAVYSTNNFGTDLNVEMSASTWYYIYLRFQAGDSSDGQYELGINTSGTITNTFSDNSVDTGAFTTSKGIAKILFRGTIADTVIYFDDIKVDSP